MGLKTLDTQRQMDEIALLDCGATGLFIDLKWAKGNYISMTELEYPILVYNVDGSCNSVGSITHEATLIIIKSRFKPIKSRIYPCSPTEQAEIDTFIDDQLAKGYICPSTSDQTSGVFFISKKDGKK